MSVDATGRLRRLLSIFPLFAEQTEVSLRDLQKSSGVDVATLIEDLAAITERGDEPGGFVASVDASIGHSHVAIRSDHFLRPLRLNVPELCALELGLAMLAASSAPDEQRTIARARARVRDAIVAMPASGQESEMWHGVAPAAASPELLIRLRDALRTRRKVRIAYRKGAGDEARERTVRSYGLVPANETWYLVGHCETSDGIRFFRLDRVEAVAVTDDAYRLPASEPLERLMATGKPFYSDKSDTLTVRYSPRIARWIAEREQVPVAEDGSVTLEHPLADVDWAVRHVLQYGPEAEVIAPHAVRDRIRTRLAALVK